MVRHERVQADVCSVTAVISLTKEHMIAVCSASTFCASTARDVRITSTETSSRKSAETTPGIWMKTDLGMLEDMRREEEADG